MKKIVIRGLPSDSEKQIFSQNTQYLSQNGVNLIFNNDIQKVTTFPVFPNKWRFYMGPLVESTSQTTSNLFDNQIQGMNPEDQLEFNWFLCARPCKEENGDKMIEVGKYSLFFCPDSGISYYVKFDADICKLKIVNPGVNNEKVFENTKYDGIAMINDETETCYKDLVCSSATLIFKDNVLEASRACPYIDFARSHANYLRKNIKDFPSDKFLKKAYPGKDSLYLRSIIRPFLLQ